jgi:REP-associated tyrosine transposase
MKEHRFDPTIHHRQSMRLPTHNYASNGAYFITICLEEPQPLLKNPELRTTMEETWIALPQRFPSIKLDEFIIMPDHIHFIVWLQPNKESHPSLGRVVGAYKSLTGRAALNYLRTKGESCGNQFWQRGYYDHVIRNEADLEEKRTYIRNNPIKEDLKHNRL